MCGIAGIVDFKHAKAARDISTMSNTLRHRGPNDEGFALFRLNGEMQEAGGADTPDDLAHLPPIESVGDYACEVALAHRRLSIIDLSPAGHGPLPDVERELWITYNGEVYNYIELREELATYGHRFHSGTDTEVILAAYRQWGVDCMRRFNGMFAFAIWDRRQKRLFCVRDRFGVKPFYYLLQDGYLAFASEIKALLANPHADGQPNPRKIYDYLANGAIVEDDQTFFTGVQQLPGSHAFTFDAENGFKQWRYYDFSYQTHFIERRYQDAVAQFRDLLTDAVKLRLRSDVAVGSSLSGGLDSSSIVTLANRLLQEQGISREVIGDQQRVFCAVYDGERFDESRHMQTVIKATGAQAHFTRPDATRLWSELEKLVWHQDEPFNSTAIFAQYCVMQLVQERGVTVLLDGQGGDEVLGGYHHYYGYYLANAVAAGRLGFAARELIGARGVSGAKWLPLLAVTGYNLAPAALQQMGWRVGGARLQSNRPIDSGLIHADFAAACAGEARRKHNPYTHLSDKLYEDVWQTNLPVLLRYEDRNSMAFSIEARVPFLDYRLVEFAFSLGANAHIRDGWTKAILRDAMTGILPENIRARRDKEGYTTPHQRWMRELTPQINALFAGEVHARDYLSPEAIDALQRPDAGEMEGVWRLINLEMWLRAFG